MGGGAGRITGGKPPLKVDQKELFLPNLAMEFDEDCPAFRRKVEALDSNVEGGCSKLDLSLEAKGILSRIPLLYTSIYVEAECA